MNQEIGDAIPGQMSHPNATIKETFQIRGKLPTQKMTQLFVVCWPAWL
jgi:hypothetical protein